MWFLAPHLLLFKISDCKNWLFDFCEALACVSGKRQCAKCGLALRFSFLQVGKKTKSILFHCHFVFHSQTIFSVIFVVAVFFRLVDNSRITLPLFSQSPHYHIFSNFSSCVYNFVNV